MIKRNNKKGFTIVELVIVIAVIAILAAVLIPTFAGVIKKAQESADIQAVRQMNTALAVEDAYKGGLTINDAVATLTEAGLNGEDYIALVSGRYFFYDATENRIVYAEYKNGTYTVLFPEDINTTGHQLLSLSGDVAKKDYTKPTVDTAANTATFSIGTAEEYAQLAADFKDLMNGKEPKGLEGFTDSICVGSAITGVSGADIIINLTADVDFKGASFNLNLDRTNFVLNGNGHTISGVVNNSGFAVSSNNDDKVASEYGGAFIGYASASTIEFNNVTFKDCHFGNEDVKASAIFVGQLNKDSSLKLVNTKVENCTVGGKKGVAVYLGHAETGSGAISVTFEGTNTVTGCELTATGTGSDEGLVAIISGRVSNLNGTATKFTVSGPAPTVSDITITAAGKNVDAASRWIACKSENLTDSDIIKEYTGSLTK